MGDIADGDSVEVSGSGSRTYTLKNVGGVYSCTCPAWSFQSLPIEVRTCKHLKAYRGAALEEARVLAAAETVLPGADAAGTTGRRARAVTAASSPSADSITVAPQLLLAHKWEVGMNVDGWWLSEKLDGVRAYWDGENFLSRQGNYFLAPDWFVENLPKVPLDGELWGGRQNFQTTVSITRRQDRGGAWQDIQYIVFDAPAQEKPFEERMQYLQEIFAYHKPPYGAVAQQRLCENEADLRQALEAVEKLGGEGLMLRQPGSLYESGRSSTLLKVKNFYDAEARVTGHTPGAGKHKGRLGALQAELPDGTGFLVGSGFTDEQRENPPPIGSLITFRYQELTKAGVPRFPTFVAQRHDLAWEQVNWPPLGWQEAKPNRDPQHAPVMDLSRVEGKQAQPTSKPPIAAASVSNEGTSEPAAVNGAVSDLYYWLEYAGGKSVRYWELSQNDNCLTIVSGRVGKTPKEEILSFPSAAIAARQAQKEAQAKIDKGYVTPLRGPQARIQMSAGAAPPWVLALQGDIVVIDDGTSKTQETLGSTQAAEQYAARMIAEKTKAGFTHAGGAGSSSDFPAAAANGQARYFEYQGGKSVRFWEICDLGDRLEERQGKVGAQGKTTVHHFDSPAEARAALEKMVRQKADKGYIEGGLANAPVKNFAATVASNPELESLILQDLDNEEAYLIYSDWLQTQGDPRGELIALQAGGADHEADQFIEDFGEQLLGELNDVDELDLAWRLGFIDSAKLRVDYESQEQVDGPSVLRDLMNHPCSVFIRRLVIDLLYANDEVNFSDAIEVLVKAGPRPSLRDLIIGDFAIGDDTELSWSHMGRCGGLWRLYPHLRSLTLQAGSMSLGKIHLPVLKSFELRTGGLDKDCIESICQAHWPELESLIVWFGAEDYGAEGEVGDLKHIFEGTGLPMLQKLGLMNSEFTDDICAAIGESVIAPRLRELDLSMGTMTDEGAGRLLSKKHVFKNLQRLNVQDNYISSAGLRMLKDFCPRVETHGQEDPDEWGPYVSVGE